MVKTNSPPYYTTVDISYKTETDILNGQNLRHEEEKNFNKMGYEDRKFMMKVTPFLSNGEIYKLRLEQSGKEWILHGIDKQNEKLDRVEANLGENLLDCLLVMQAIEGMRHVITGSFQSYYLQNSGQNNNYYGGKLQALQKEQKYPAAMSDFRRPQIVRP